MTQASKIVIMMTDTQRVDMLGCYGNPEQQCVWAGVRFTSDRNALTITPADFLGCNTFVDHEIGRVLEAIDRYADDALVIYTSAQAIFLTRIA